eukprot:CAMPEP_0185277528 /NCGR_PEP_ID=MMETSP1359-20130426/58813_1 /TAXON_ID=552665 /ORGANISM="Bigelowiella longifila, Strain CCMP242" /LENGTH=346 /DNA_ID=CAMNT_0027871677 /DNA_START=57 /DNA_END=1097 /DNA_ORIENTATION=-
MSGRALFVCAGKGDLAGVKKELEAGASIDCKHGGYGITPLITASENNHFDVVKHLVETGKASVNVIAKSGTTALIEAACNDNKEVVKYLIEVGKADPSFKGGDEKKTALEWALRCDSKNTVEYLSDLSASGTGAALFAAAQAGNAAGVISELKLGAPVDSKHGGYGYTALIAAAENNHLEVVKALMYNGKADVNATNKNGTSALIEAASHDNIEIVKFLVEEGKADVDYRGGEEQKTASEWAVICGRKRAAEYLSNLKNLNRKESKSTAKLTRKDFEKLDEAGLIQWLTSVASKFELKDELINAIEGEELKGRDLLCLSQKELKEILKKTGRVRRLTEALEQFRLS